MRYDGRSGLMFQSSTVPLVPVIRTVMITPSLEAAEAEKATLVQAAEQQVPSLDPIELLARLPAVYIAMVKKLVANLRRDVDRARRDLSGIVGRQTLKPDDSGRHLVGVASFETRGIIDRMEIFGNVVAGAGFANYRLRLSLAGKGRGL
jgi:hypothetical protein